MILTLTALGCGSATLVKTNDGGVGGAGGAGAGTAGVGGHGGAVGGNGGGTSNSVDAGADHTQHPDAGCSADAGCGAGFLCDVTTQTCKPKLSPGTACSSTTQCATGVCSSADHVCCDSDCAGICESCVASKSGGPNGVCTALPSGNNADNDCAPGSTTCGTTGFCDGKRACALAASGVACTGSSSCSGAQLTVTPASCNGAGACTPGTASAAACPGGVACMNTTTCLPATCTSTASCASGSFCDLASSTCSPTRALGATCTANAQCAGGFCADGVCCTNACAGTCEACKMSKTGVADGHCAAVTAGTDPDSECSQDTATCGHNGLCDHNGGTGGGACAFTAMATSCTGTFACSGSGTTATTTGSCDGSGTCKQSSSVAGTCAGYTCGSATACGTTCSATSGCIAGYTCSGGTCVASAFATGPCVTTPDFTTAVVFGRGNDVKIHQRSNNGTAWGTWVTLSLDATVLDTRSDLDCSANSDVTHLTATGANPLGAFMHSTGSGTAFNAFFRELAPETFSPGASVKAYPQGNNYVIGALDVNAIYYDVFDGTYTQVTPVTTRVNTFGSATIDISQQAGGGGAARLIAAFDSTGLLDIYTNYISSAPASWVAPVALASPSGTTYAFSPTICVDTGEMGGSVVHVEAVAGGQLWDSWTSDVNSNAFSVWGRISTQAASAPDCTMMGDGSVHAVVLSSAGHILDIHGAPGGWTTTDLGTF